MNDDRLASDLSERSVDTDDELQSEELARRNFLKRAGRFAAITPPAITLLLGTSLSSRAIAGSAGVEPGRRGPRRGWQWNNRRRGRSGPKRGRNPFGFF